ncbi:hypothetical protein SAMN05216490_2201 [Mucilaginibacter mallensis]|uniref:Uncharacterized protein n=1 Tax=Mucilaginibacter mallensis TaxID=652787 RepID=A0A1H1WJ05_MUCMA|nr:hypothetical protein SAMN05216490_2201 [Mucilaginibacter mallensis]
MPHANEALFILFNDISLNEFDVSFRENIKFIKRNVFLRGLSSPGCGNINLWEIIKVEFEKGE